MSFKGMVRDMKDGIANLSSIRTRVDGRSWHSRRCTRSHVAPVQTTQCVPVEQGRWANLPPELLLDIIHRVEESETCWPARTAVLFCAAVCRSWREATKEIVQTPEQCGRLTFPISLKQPGPRDVPIQCFIKRDRETSIFQLFLGQTPSENASNKMLLAARKVRRATSTEYLISLAADSFSRSSNTYLGKLRSNFLGTKFTVYDSQPPCDGPVRANNTQSSRTFSSKQVYPRLPTYSQSIATITYELNVLRTRGPRKLHCVVHSIPISSIQEGGTAPTPISFPHIPDRTCPQGKEDLYQGGTVDTSTSSTKWPVEPVAATFSGDPLVLKNKAPRWHEQLQCWCLNFRGRVSVASVKNFQLVAGVEPHHNVSDEEQEKVLLQFGKIGKDIFTMDFRYPLSAFQAFAICLSSFDTKPACE